MTVNRTFLVVGAMAWASENIASMRVVDRKTIEVMDRSGNATIVHLGEDEPRTAAAVVNQWAIDGWDAVDGRVGGEA